MIAQTSSPSAAQNKNATAVVENCSTAESWNNSGSPRSLSTCSITSEDEQKKAECSGLVPPTNTMHPRYSPFKIFIGKLPMTCTNELLAAHFAKYGNVLKAEMKVDTVTQISKGFGFVIYDSVASAEAAVNSTENLMGEGTDQRSVDVKSCNENKDSGAKTFKQIEAARRSAREATGAVPTDIPQAPTGLKAGGCKLFVGGLPWDCEEKTIRDYFSNFGGIKKCEVVCHPVSGRPRGYAFVIYNDEASATAALQVAVHVLDGKKVDVKSAFSNNKKEKVRKQEVQPEIVPTYQYVPQAENPQQMMQLFQTPDGQLIELPIQSQVPQMEQPQIIQHAAPQIIQHSAPIQATIPAAAPTTEYVPQYIPHMETRTIVSGAQRYSPF